MVQEPDILKVIQGNLDIDPINDLLFQKKQNIPGAIHYDIRRYYAQDEWNASDTGMMVYHYSKNHKEDCYIDLRYCTIGNRYCTNKDCSSCSLEPTTECSGKLKTIDVFNFHFTEPFLNQFTSNVKLTSHKDSILAFEHQQSFSRVFSLCGKKRGILDSILNHCYSGAMENIFINAKVHELLLFSLNSLVEEQTATSNINCKFLADDHSKNAIKRAREILLQHIGNPLTIKELSRKVAMNECYLKKGFKEVYGTTIFDFYQQQRMEHAKYLLYEKNLSVTDVSSLLGYSSISHFSAAFKKHTGLKPCELLH